MVIRRLKVTANSFLKESAAQLFHSFIHSFIHKLSLSTSVCPTPFQILRPKSEWMNLISAIPNLSHLWRPDRHRTNIWTSKYKCPCFTKDQFMPFRFCGRLAWVLVFTSPKKSEEDFHFDKKKKKKGKSEISIQQFSIAFAGSCAGSCHRGSALLRSRESGTTKLSLELCSASQHQTTTDLDCDCEHLCLCIFFFFPFFLGPLPLHLDVPRLRVES